MKFMFRDVLIHFGPINKTAKYMISQSLSASKSEISRSSEDLGIFYVPKNLVKFTRNLQTWRDLTLEIFYQ